MLTDKTLEQVYALVPEIHCQGLCTASCGPIAMTQEEWERIEKKLGHPMPVTNLKKTPDASCPLLKLGRCSVYEVRPLICRLYGSAFSLSCPYGCTTLKELSDEDAGKMIALLSKLSKTNRDRSPYIEIDRQLARPIGNDTGGSRMVIKRTGPVRS